MKHLANKWKMPILVATLSIFATIFALDLVVVDATVEPPEAVSISGSVVSCERAGGGRAVATPAGFEFHTLGVWTDEMWGGTNAPPVFISSFEDFSGEYPSGEGAFTTGFSEGSGDCPRRILMQLLFSPI